MSKYPPPTVHRQPHPPYFDEYQGRHYGPEVVHGSATDLPDAEGIEAPTRGYQALLHSVHGDEALHRLAKEDPGMLDLLMGVLFRYDP